MTCFEPKLFLPCSVITFDYIVSIKHNLFLNKKKNLKFSQFLSVLAINQNENLNFPENNVEKILIDSRGNRQANWNLVNFLHKFYLCRNFWLFTLPPKICNLSIVLSLIGN